MALGPAEAARIEAKFDAAQAKTHAPLIGVLAHSSGSRDADFLLGACVLALLAPLPLLVFTDLSAHRIYILQMLTAIVAAVIGALPWVRRALTPKRVQHSAGHRAALAQFVLRGLDHTQCGVLVYVSLAEHYIRIVPAEDAARAIPNARWQALIDEALGPLAAGKTEAALAMLADRCADTLAAPFPPDPSWRPLERHRFHLV